MQLDLEGRLLLFEAIPQQFETESVAAAPPEWKPLLAAAAIDAAQLRPVEPQWTPAMAFDARAAWTGTLPGADRIPIRVEAAAWRGRPVSFRVVGPWTAAERDRAAESSPFILVLYVLYWLLAFPAACVFAWRNLKAKRSDSSGAVRLGVAFLLLCNASGWLVMAHAAGAAEVGLVVESFLGSLAVGVFVMAAYLALEPYVRRRCPRLLISWARLLQGNWRDPLLAANVLVGIAAGLFVMLLAWGTDLLRMRSGYLPDPPSDYLSILGARQFAGQTFAFAAMVALIFSLLYVFLFFLARLALRRDFPAAAAVVLVLAAFLSPTSSTFPANVPVLVLFFGVVLFVTIRFGLVAVYTCFVLTVGVRPSFTTDPSRWYFVYTLVYFLVVLTAAAIAFRLALGKRKLLRDESLA
jgi:serine/threonine-protein kinase